MKGELEENKTELQMYIHTSLLNRVYNEVVLALME